MNASKLQYLLKAYMEVSPETKENDLFHSNFARFNLPLMDIEVMGNLQVKKNNIWQPVCVQEYREVSVGKMIEYQQLKSKKEFYLFLVEKKI